LKIIETSYFNYLVLGSTGNEYEVSFSVLDSNAAATCSCDAGIRQQHCKHRIAIMRGDFSGVIQGDDMKKLITMLKGTDLQKAFEAYLSAELSYEGAKKIFTSAKTELRRAFYKNV
jgi:uncharacterized Zn finger protein